MEIRIRGCYSDQGFERARVQIDLETVALVLLVELLVDRHHLGVGARLDVVPRRRVVLAVPDDVGSTCESAEVPIGCRQKNQQELVHPCSDDAM